MRSQSLALRTSNSTLHTAERAALTSSEAAERLGLCRATIYRYIASGKLRTFKVGRSRRVSTDALRDFIAMLESEEHQV